MNIKEHRTTMEPVEKLEEVLLDDSDHEWTTKIGTLASPTIRQELAVFLRSNRDIFAWTYEDIPGINPLVIVHKLNVSPSFPPIRQKKQVFTPKRDQAIAKKVRKLQEASFIREVYYLDWLANVVMVKKARWEVEDVRRLYRPQQSMPQRQLSSPMSRCTSRLYSQTSVAKFYGRLLELQPNSDARRWSRENFICNQSRPLLL